MSAGAAAAEAPPIRLHVFERQHLPAVRTLNSVLFPVKYHERVYEDALKCGPVSFVAFHGSTLVGAILCRLEALPGGAAQVYIISLGVLAPFRGAGVGSQLLAASLAIAQDDPAIQRALLHVHTANDEALAWYAARGFCVQETLAGYYQKLSPPDAAVLTKQLNPPPDDPAGDDDAGGDGGGCETGVSEAAAAAAAAAGHQGGGGNGSSSSEQPAQHPGG